MWIQYCGGWGYLKYALIAKARLKAAFPAYEFSFTLKKDIGTTGNLEVMIVTEKGRFWVHQKSKGDGYISVKTAGRVVSRAKEYLWELWSLLSFLSSLILLQAPFFQDWRSWTEEEEIMI